MRLRLNEQTCPTCNNEVKVTVPDGAKEPVTGDVIVCQYCAELLVLDPLSNIVKLENEEIIQEVMSVPEIQKVVDKIRGGHKPEQHVKYEQAIIAMSLSAKRWMEKNNGLSPLIQYNYPDKIMLVAVLSDAIRNNFISVNDDAKKMIEELGWGKGKAEPTAFMFRTALERAFSAEQ